jgi:hypothetical protein
MNRRELLLSIGALLGTANLAPAQLFKQRDAIYGGWYDDPEARLQYRRRARPYFRDHDHHIRGSGQGRQVLLWHALESAMGVPFTPHYQKIGDCVSQAFGLGADTLAAIQIVLKGANEKWPGKASTEAIYGGSRVEVGGGKLRRKEGSTGAWAAGWVKDYGIIARGQHGEYDLTNYDPNLAALWGRTGVPDELEPLARQHPIQTTSLVRSWEEACDSVANGYPVIICSSVGYNMTTDADGFLRQNDTWYHSMLLWAIDTKSNRPGGNIANSWGSRWINGPQHPLGSPPGCFWADSRNINRAIEEGDSYAISNFVGYPAQNNLDYSLI